MSVADLEAKVEEKKKLLQDTDDHFEAEVKRLQETYEALQKTKDDTTKEIKESGLGLMTSVLMHAKKAKEEL